MTDQIEQIRNLLIAILEQAIWDIRRKNIYSDEAMRWLESNGLKNFFGFRNICLILGLNPEITRKNILDYDYNIKNIKKELIKYKKNKLIKDNDWKGWKGIKTI